MIQIISRPSGRPALLSTLALSFVAACAEDPPPTGQATRGVATTQPGFSFYPPWGTLTTAPEAWEPNALPFLSMVIEEIDPYPGQVRRVLRTFTETSTPHIGRHPSAEAYSVGWNIDQDTIEYQYTYRIRVLAQGTEIGRSDIPADAYRILAMAAWNHQTLWIKFRVEERAIDADLDGVYDWLDVCPTTSDPDQLDSNGDGVGDACTPVAPIVENTGSEIDHLATVRFSRGPIMTDTVIAVTAAGGAIAAGSTRDIFAVNPGHALIVRRLADGRPDPSFGQNGLIEAPTDIEFYSRAVIELSDGSTIVGGAMDSYSYLNGRTGIRPLLIKVGANGQIDPSFGYAYTYGQRTPEGFCTASPCRNVKVADLEPFPGGRFFAALDGAFDLRRFNSDGTPDTTFGIGGQATREPSTALLAAIAMQADGKIVGFGNVVSDQTLYPSQTMLKRWNADGSTDTSFGAGGVREWFTGGGGGNNRESIALDVTVLDDGTIVTLSEGYQHSRLRAFNPDGSDATGFGDGGLFDTALHQFNARSVLAAAANKLIVTGTRLDAPYSYTGRFAALRLRADGSLDTTFGAGGWAESTISGDSYLTTGVAGAIRADGALLLAGTGFAGPPECFYLYENVCYYEDIPRAMSILDIR